MINKYSLCLNNPTMSYKALILYYAEISFYSVQYKLKSIYYINCY